MIRVARALVVREFIERTRDRWVLVISVLFALLAAGDLVDGAAEVLRGDLSRVRACEGVRHHMVRGHRAVMGDWVVCCVEVSAAARGVDPVAVLVIARLDVGVAAGRVDAVARLAHSGVVPRDVEASAGARDRVNAERVRDRALAARAAAEGDWSTAATHYEAVAATAPADRRLRANAALARARAGR